MTNEAIKKEEELKQLALDMDKTKKTIKNLEFMKDNYNKQLKDQELKFGQLTLEFNSIKKES
jgi:hypothetical protein